MAKDLYHDTVRVALEKDGWTITDDPFKISAAECAITHRIRDRVSRSFVSMSKDDLVILGGVYDKNCD